MLPSTIIEMCELQINASFNHIFKYFSFPYTRTIKHLIDEPFCNIAIKQVLFHCCLFLNTKPLLFYMVLSSSTCQPIKQGYTPHIT